MDVKDKRGKLINETFKNIRFIKMSALESYFMKRIVDIKLEELGWVRRNFYRMFTSNIINSLGPVLFMTTMYSFHLYWTGQLKLEDAFVSSIIFGIFQGSFRSIAFEFLYIFEILVAGRRISFFLLSEEIDKEYMDRFINKNADQSKDVDTSDTAVDISDGCYYWQDKVKQKLMVEEKDRVSEKKKRDKIKGVKDEEKQAKEKEDIDIKSKKTLSGSFTE